MLVSDLVAKILLAQNIKEVFLYPGGTIAPLVNSFISVGIQVEVFKSEQGAGYAALAKSRLTGRPQIVLVTSGPGATNIVSPIADAYYDSTPLICITGQIGSNDLMKRKKVRQRGFQETPTTSIFSDITKFSKLILKKEDVYKTFNEAFITSQSDRCGPALIDFPMNIQRESIQNKYKIQNLKPKFKTPVNKFSLTKAVLKEIAFELSQAKRPILHLGQGAMSIEKHILNSLLRQFPFFTTSFLGIGSLPSDHKKSLGYIGHTGHKIANSAVHESDFLLVLGSRLDIRQTGTEVKEFVKKGKVAWVDIDSLELANPRIKAKWRINACASFFTKELLKIIPKNTNHDNEWVKLIHAKLKLQNEDKAHFQNNNKVYPAHFLKLLNKYITTDLKNKNRVIVTGVGLHQHWAARHLKISKGLKFLSSGGHGTMGYDLPSSIGAAMTKGIDEVICIVGDGSFLMNIQELAALKERDLSVKIIIMNNHRLGIVSQFQNITFGDDPSTGNFQTPNFCAISEGFGISGKKLISKDKIDQSLKWLFKTNGPKLLEVIIPSDADLSPMLLAGQKMDEMWDER